MTKKNGCGLLHGQGRSFVPYKKNVGFSTVWQTVLNFEWQEFNTASRDELKKELFERSIQPKCYSSIFGKFAIS